MNYTPTQDKKSNFERPKQSASTPGLPTFEQIKNVIKSNDVKGLINQAEQCAKYLAENKVEPTQMRKFLEEVTKIPGCDKPVDIEMDNSPIEPTVKSKLIVLRPKFAYTVSRKGNLKLKDFNTKIIDEWLKSEEFLNTKIQLEYFHLFIESVVAFHKVYKGNN